MTHIDDVRGDEIAAPTPTTITPQRATRLGWSFIATGVLLLGLLFTCQGCIPMMIGGYVGYQMAQQNAHSDWCAQHVGDPSCHP